MAVYTTIDDPGLYFNTILYTGDIVDGDGSGHTLAITGVGFAPNLVWHKCRSAGQPHLIVDTVRGTTSYNFFYTNTVAEVTANVNGAIKTIDSDGITVEAGTDSSSKSNVAGADGFTYAFWNWKETATAGFDIVSYTGTGSAKTESHSLSAVPHFIIVKNRTDTDAWRIYHHKNTAAPETDYLVLDSTDATADSVDQWNDTAPTSSVFTVGTSDQTNENTDSFIAYLFSEKQGFSKFGSYTGNGDVDGPFVYTGFKPAFLIVKNTATAPTDWIMIDNKRPGYNANLPFQPNKGDAEGSSTTADFLSNGFKVRNQYGGFNGDGDITIYIAFAEAPFVNSNGVPCNAR